MSLKSPRKRKIAPYLEGSLEFGRKSIFEGFKGTATTDSGTISMGPPFDTFTKPVTGSWGSGIAGTGTIGTWTTTWTYKWDETGTVSAEPIKTPSVFRSKPRTHRSPLTKTQQQMVLDVIAEQLVG